MTNARGASLSDDETRQEKSLADIESAKRVLKFEIQGIEALSGALDGDLSEAFRNAADLIEQATGRVIVTGMGKSGHIARKIAATFASTGEPALYVHPGEASHGDLGMITHQDVVIALSNSGNTPELSDIIAYTRRFSIPLIGITGRADSPLAEASDAPLVFPHAPEACPMGLAPTTSTTVMLALGDALAVAMIERKGFTSSDFLVLHPGGQLGKQLTRVRDLMHSGEALPIVDGNAPMSEVLIAMTRKSFGCVGVVGEDGRLAGVITDGDLRRHMGDALLKSHATAVMTANPKTIRPQALAAEALGLMSSKKITSLFVVDETEQPVGLIHIHDCFRAEIA